MEKEPNATSDKILPQCVLQVGVLLLATVLLVFCSLPLMILGEKISHVKLHITRAGKDRKAMCLKLTLCTERGGLFTQ